MEALFDRKLKVKLILPAPERKLLPAPKERSLLPAPREKLYLAGIFC
jgi:hypothetical protein